MNNVNKAKRKHIPLFRKDHKILRNSYPVPMISYPVCKKFLSRACKKKQKTLSRANYYFLIDRHLFDHYVILIIIVKKLTGSDEIIQPIPLNNLKMGLHGVSPQNRKKYV